MQVHYCPIHYLEEKCSKPTYDFDVDNNKTFAFFQSCVVLCAIHGFHCAPAAVRVFLIKMVIFWYFTRFSLRDLKLAEIIYFIFKVKLSLLPTFLHTKMDRALIFYLCLPHLCQQWLYLICSQFTVISIHPIKYQVSLN